MLALPGAPSARLVASKASRPNEQQRVVGIVPMSYLHPSPPPAFASPHIEHFDHYLGKMVLFADHRRVLLSMDELLLPRDLVHAAMFFHAQYLRRPPPRLPRYLQLQFPPLQLQRFLRGCVLAAAHALVTPPAYERVDPAAWRWSHCIFVRVMSGFVRRAEVRLLQ